MYNAYWGLEEKPFENTPDPRFIFYTPQHEEGLSRLLYAVREEKGAALLTGLFGCGKTLLGRVLFKELEKDIYRVAFITNPQMEYIELVMAIAIALGARDLPTRRSDVLANVVLQVLQQTLQDNARDGKKTVVIIDESHIIEDKHVWEGLRLLLNFQADDKFLMTLILLGQPELKEKIESFKQFSQRIAIRCHVSSLSEEESKSYVVHRLKIAGREIPLFTPEALRFIYGKSGGIPRRINSICDLALLSGFGKSSKEIDLATLQEVVRDIEG
ncbi:MAG: AAA family ATPase [Candidatus Omnitrophica bacterium]|nr:AAA family ATPase [Candidatus Omnitrophota bacterium]